MYIKKVKFEIFYRYLIEGKKDDAKLRTIDQTNELDKSDKYIYDEIYFFNKKNHLQFILILN